MAGPASFELTTSAFGGAGFGRLDHLGKAVTRRFGRANCHPCRGRPASLYGTFVKSTRSQNVPGCLFASPVRVSIAAGRGGVTLGIAVRLGEREPGYPSNLSTFLNRSRFLYLDGIVKKHLRGTLSLCIAGGRLTSG